MKFLQWQQQICSLIVILAYILKTLGLHTISRFELKFLTKMSNDFRLKKLIHMGIQIFLQQ